MTNKEIIQKAMLEGRVLLTETESKEIVKEAGVAVTDTRLARSKNEAVSLSNQMGYPVVLKIASKDIVHKSDAGGVKVGLNTPEEVGKAYDEIHSSISQKHPEAVIQGVTVQKAARPGTEVIIGMSKDAQFGPVLMFGLGGIFVEVFKDVSFRIVPVSQRDVQEMIQETKGYPLLQGYRGKEPANIPVLVEMILKVSKFVEENPQIKELDLNPIFAYADGAVAVDARIILEEDG